MLSRRTILASVAVAGVALVTGAAAFAHGGGFRHAGMMKRMASAMIDEHGILRARGIINSREHLESLFEAKHRGVASLQDYFERAQDSRAA